MTHPKDPTENMASIGAGITQALTEAVDQTKPVIGLMAERMNERLQDLAQHGKDAALEAKYKIENQARQATTTAEHYIQHAPFKSVMVAAGIGLLTGVITTWLMRERHHGSE